ncbi:MAG: D-aminoacyl-tRNA deacylase [Actinomycetota bacterium]|nr:D-aminoacyl-tRNA deacylase [Actinomycetota bacterium]
MQVVIQRVQRAAVTVGDEVSGRIGPGLLALVGVGRHSTEADAAWLASKTVALRVFGDDAGRMNRSVADVGGAVLAVSQFTLYGDVSRGRRPSFVGAADPADGQRLYEAYCAAITVPVAKGVFGAHMVIDLIADGPVTMLLRRETLRPVGQDMR